MNRNFVEPLIAVLAVIFIVGLMPLLGQAADDTQTLQQLSQSFADIAKEVTQSVVSIKIDGRQRPKIRRFIPDEDLKRYSGQYDLGAGIIVSPDGYIVTASPLVEEADKIRVALSDEREFEAELTGSDPKTGIAVIKTVANTVLISY